MRTLAGILLIVAAHLLVDWPAYRDIGFLADDWFNVGLAASGHASGLPIPDGAVAALFRPLLPKLFWLEWQCFGAWTPGYHATNSLLHCGAAVFLMLIASRLTGSRFAGLSAGLLAVNHPACSEVTHWIMARTNLLAACFGLGGVWCWIRADEAKGRIAGIALRSLALAAIGTALLGKETAVLLLPPIAVLALLRANGLPAGPGQRLRRVVRELAPLGVVALLYLLARFLTVHTLAVGAAGSWQPKASGGLLDLLGQRLLWIWQVLWPVHADFGSRWLRTPMAVVMAVLSVAGFAGCIRGGSGARRLAAFLIAWLACAAIVSAGFAQDPEELTGVRNDYEAVLALSAFCGIGLALLPRGGWIALAVLALVQAVSLDGNRQNWLGAGRLSLRVRQEVIAKAQVSDPQPVRVYDVPSAWHGALVKSAEWFEYQPPFAPPGVAERVQVTNDQVFTDVLRELAAVRAAPQEHGPDAMRRFQVAWVNGELLRLVPDARWPKTLGDGTVLRYARVGRARVFARCELPVQVLLRGVGAPMVVQVKVTRAGAGTVAEARQTVEFQGGEAAVELRPRLPAGLAPGPVRLDLRLGEESVPLATIEVVER